MRAGNRPASAPEWGPEPSRDRTHVLTYAALLTVTAAAWLQVLWSALTDDMAGMDMAVPLSVLDGVVFVASWTVMMTAMMLPSALPMIALYGATQRTVENPAARTVAVALFTLIYLGLWALTGVPIYFGSVGLGRLEPGTRAYGIAGMLVVAGLFQLSWLKQVCLRNCRTPLGFLLGHWRPGWRGGFTMGWRHALYCLGCCWALTVVLVAAGAMGLPWVLLIAAVVAVEKLLPYGQWFARLSGVALVLLGLAVAVRPELAVVLRAGCHSM
jgi:predicted metal-binding membrane protein